MPFNLGGPELLIVLVIILVVFGAGRLPNVMRDMGSGVREFRRAQNEPPATAPAAALSGGADFPVAPVVTRAQDAPRA